MANLIALIMLSFLSRTTSTTCRPSFISLHRRQFVPQNSLLGGLSSSSLSGPNAVAAGSPYYRSSCKNAYYSSTHSRDNGRIESSTTSLRASPSNPVTTTHASSSSKSCEKETIEPFTWPQLINLFRCSNNNYIPSDHPKLALFRRSASVQESYEDHKKYLDAFWRSAYDYLVVSKFGAGFGFEKVISSYADESSENRSGISNLIEDDCDDDLNSDQNCIPPNSGRIYQARPSLTQASKYTIENEVTYLSLVPNDFPYDVAEGIEHWCLWKIGGCSSTEGILREELSWALKELKNNSNLNLQRVDGNYNTGSGCIIKRKEQTISNVVSDSQMPLNDLVQLPNLILDTLYWVNPPHLQSMPEIHHAHILVLKNESP